MNLNQTIQTKRLMEVIAFKGWLPSIIDLTEEDNEDNNNNDSTFNQSKKSPLNSNVITIDDDSEDDELYDHRYLGIMDEEESNDYLFTHLFKSQNTPLPENNKGRQLIKVIGYKDNLDYPVTFMYKYLPPLSSIASLNTIINRLQSLLERQENEK